MIAHIIFDCILYMRIVRLFYIENTVKVNTTGEKRLNRLALLHFRNNIAINIEKIIK